MGISIKSLLPIGIILIIVLLFGSFFQTGSLFSGLENDGSEARLISQDSESVTYEFSFILADSTGGAYECNRNKELPFSQSYTTNRGTGQGHSLVFVNGIQLNKDFTASQVKIEGLKAVLNPCSSNSSFISPKYENLNAICNFVDQGNIKCTFSGTATNNLGEAVNYYGIKSGSAIVTFYKEGYSAPSEQIVEQVQVIEGRTITTSSATDSSSETTTFLVKVINFFQNIINSIKSLF
jgi:hypothetical protein